MLYFLLAVGLSVFGLLRFVNFARCVLPDRCLLLLPDDALGLELLVDCCARWPWAIGWLTEKLLLRHVCQTTVPHPGHRGPGLVVQGS